MTADFVYSAFVSYSHADRQLADWLHRELESYRVPAKLIGSPAAFGPIPARLTPIFKDREELSASGSLGELIEAALARSRALIVVCSPAAAGSRWVNEEVRTFKQVHGEQRIYAVIVAGEPWGSRIPGREADECFPPALRFAVGPDGVVTDRPAEPVAADFRASGDGRKLGKLKLVAGLIGVRLDELVRRESQRRQRRLVYFAAASLAGMTVTSGLAISAVQARDEAREQRNEAEHQRSEADGLVEFMLTDLRTKLEPVGRLDALDSVGRRALTYYSGQDLAELDADALGRRARALQLVGEVGDLRGDSEAARKGFFEAARSTAELLQRDPNNWRRIYDHAQSEFWLAYDSHNRGDNPAALRHFIAYRDLGRRMVALDPKRLESQVELASGEINLGVALVRENRLRDAIASFDRASASFNAIRPRTRDIALNLNQALGHKASALYALGDNRDALATRREQFATLGGPPLSNDDREVHQVRAIVLAQIGIAHLAEGNLAEAERTLREAVGRWDELVALDPANTMWRGEQHAARMWRAVAMSAANRAAARDELSAVIHDQRRLAAASKDWAHKINLLKMISFDLALGGSSDRMDEPLVAEALSRRRSLRADERAMLAAILISEGDRLAASDSGRAKKLWNEAFALLSVEEPATIALIQRARVAGRLGRSAKPRSTIAPKAFAGIFSRGAGR